MSGKFAVFTYAPLSFHEGKVYVYAPYGKEMNLWLKHVGSVLFVCPSEPYHSSGLLCALEISVPFRHIEIPDFNMLTWPARFKAIPAIVICFFKICYGMWLADHIHLRVPGNIGLIASVAQLFFPFTKKTAKYAGNWDWSSRQPLTYRIQQRLLSNTFLTRNIQVLIYGHWPGLNRNLLPFFTASYSEKEKEQVEPRKLDFPLQFIFAGFFFEGKQPLLAAEAVASLHRKGIPSVLHMFGNGPDFERVSGFIRAQQLEDVIILHGNQPASVLKRYFQTSHFLIFLSKSEGWPKVVAESMFWGCVPITTRVSCVAEMTGHGMRGKLVEAGAEEVEGAVRYYLDDPEAYRAAAVQAMDWSRQFTLEKFESSIAGLL